MEFLVLRCWAIIIHFLIASFLRNATDIDSKIRDSDTVPISQPKQ